MPKPIKILNETLKTLKNDEVFQHLTQNAFDFLRAAVREFDAFPKYSLVHFATGVELLLKARLAFEHWVLVVDKGVIDSISHKGLLSGNSYTVSVENSKKRITNLFPDEIKKETLDSFEKLAKDRNRAIHFGLPQNSKEEIAKLLCQTWYHIHQLLTNQWLDVFDCRSEDIKTLNTSMMRFQEYLKEKYEKIKKQIEDNKSNGIRYVHCPSCEYDSLRCIKEAMQGEYFSFSVQKCDVCELNTTSLFMKKCPKCKAKTRLSEEEGATCKRCNHIFSPEEICEALDVMDKAAWCCSCQTKTVVGLQRNAAAALQCDWCCTDCFEKFESGEVIDCEFCYRPIAGGGYHDYFEGCFECGGMSEKIAHDERY